MSQASAHLISGQTEDLGEHAAQYSEPRQPNQTGYSRSFSIRRKSLGRPYAQRRKCSPTVKVASLPADPLPQYSRKCKKKLNLGVCLFGEWRALQRVPPAPVPIYA